MASSADGIFLPVDADVGLGLARRVLGCTVETLWKGTSCADAGLIATIAGVINVGAAVLAGFLMAWWLGREALAMAESGGAERSGLMQGRSWLRIGIVAVLMLPLKSGFTIAQVLVLQTAIFSSGLADTVWSKAADAIAGGGYATTAIPAGSIEPRLRGELAAALWARSAGYVCADGLNKVAAAHGFSGSVTATRDVASTGWTGSAVTHTWGFESTGFYRGSSSICGQLSYMLSPSGSPITNATDAPTYDALNAIADNLVAAGVRSALTTVDSWGRAIATGVEGGAEETALKAAFRQGVEAAATAVQAGMASALSGAEANALAKAYLAKAQAGGWVMAPSWQRALTNITTKLEGLRGAVTITSAAPERLETWLPGGARGTARVMWEPYLRDMTALTALTGYIAEFSRVTPSASAGATPVADSSAGVTANAMRAMLGAFKIDGGDTAFVDPFAELSAAGAALGYASAGTSVAGLALDWLPATAVASRTLGIGGSVSALGTAFGIAAFILAGILPLVPMLYFIAGVLAWLINIVEAIFGASLWSFRLVTTPPQARGLFDGAEGGLILALGLLLRPSLMVAGLVVSLLLASAGITVLNTFSESVFAIMLPLDGGPSTSAMMGAAAIAIYVCGAVVIVLMSSSVIATLPEAVLRVVGSAVDGGAERIGGALVGAVGAQSGMARAFGAAVRRAGGTKLPDGFLRGTKSGEK